MISRKMRRPDCWSESLEALLCAGMGCFFNLGEAELTRAYIHRFFLAQPATRFRLPVLQQRGGCLRIANALIQRWRVPAAVCFLSLTVLLSGCSIRKVAINKLGDSLGNGGTTFASDNDPEFVGQAIPFSLKLIESLLAESPKHRGLLFAAASGFTQYSYVFVQQQSEEIESLDLEKSAVLRARARSLYLRGRDYG